MHSFGKLFRNATILSLIFCCNDVAAQLSKRQIKRNNSRLMTYQGKIRNKFGSNYKYASVGFSTNAFSYYGDLSPTQKQMSTDLSLTRPGFGFFLGYRIAPGLSVQPEYAHGVLRGSDNESANKNDLDNGVFRYKRNLSFRNRVDELSLVTIIDIFQNHSFYTDRVFFTPYISFGVAILHHNPQGTVPKTDLHGNPFPNAGEWTNLRPLGTEGQLTKLKASDANYGNTLYSRIQPAIPLSLGARIRLGNQFDLSADFSLRYLFTDYIDDVSRNYVDLGVFGNNELARAMSYRTNEIILPSETYQSEIDGKMYSTTPGYGQEHKENKRGNKNDNDFYTVFSIRFSYILENLPGQRPSYR